MYGAVLPSYSSGSSKNTKDKKDNDKINADDPTNKDRILEIFSK